MTPARQAELRAWAEMHVTQTSLPLRHDVRAKLLECLDALRDAEQRAENALRSAEILRGGYEEKKALLAVVEQERDALQLAVDDMRRRYGELRTERDALRAKLNDATAYCSGEFPCEASTHAASLELQLHNVEAERASARRETEAMRALNKQLNEKLDETHTERCGNCGTTIPGVGRLLAERDEVRWQLAELKAVHDYCHFASPSDPTGVRRGLTEVANADLRNRLRAVEGVLATSVRALRDLASYTSEAPITIRENASAALAAAEALQPPK